MEIGHCRPFLIFFPLFLPGLIFCTAASCSKLVNLSHFLRLVTFQISFRASSEAKLPYRRLLVFLFFFTDFLKRGRKILGESISVRACNTYPSSFFLIHFQKILSNFPNLKWCHWFFPTFVSEIIKLQSCKLL